MKGINLGIIAIEEWIQYKGTEKIFNKIIVENFWKEFKEGDVLQEVYITQKQKGPKRTLPMRCNNQNIKGTG